MKIYPAIDLIDGKCVRLEKGDFTQVKQYAPTPLQVAQQYQAAGAEYLHVVDLDGAKSGQVQQTKLIGSIVQSCDLKVQAGGGVRSLEDVKTLLDVGVDKVIIGSLAVKDFAKTKNIFETVGANSITLAFDLFVDENNDMHIATHGWQSKSDLDFLQVLEAYLELGLTQVLCTDISKDGMLTGPNFQLYENLSNKYPNITFLASGGISQLSDFARLRQSGTKGVIIGKALYENKFTLKEVFDAD